jgi:integrase
MSKRPPGVLRDKKRGTWYFVVDAPGADGKRRQVLQRGFKTMEGAQLARDRFRAKVKAGAVPTPSDDSVAAFSDAWVAALPAEGLEASTVKHYYESTARLMPYIGAIPLQSLAPLDLDAAYAALLAIGRAPRTVRASHVAIRKMLKEAVRLGKVGRNVADDARPPSARAARAKRYPTWNYEELLRFLAAVADDGNVAFWTVAAFTGVRVGEMVALRWANVDLSGSTLTVCESVGSGRDGAYTKTPKSDASGRVIELDEELVECLKAHRKVQTERQLAIGAGWRDLGLVFAEIDGSAITPSRQSKRWSDLARRHAATCGLPVIRLHDLRHSHATQLLAADVRVDIVTERLGHESVAFTLQQYGHRYAGDQRSGLARLRAASG